MYVISYDIVSDRLRNKVVKTLKGYGERVQYSVFECKITGKQYERLYTELEKLMKNSTEDTIRIYHLCKNCQNDWNLIGVEKAKRWEEKNIIIL